VCEAIETVGATLRLLPAYSPDLKPIEQAFAKPKALLRSRAMRSVEALWNALSIIACFTRAECANYFRNTSYLQSG
jgi:transposase